MKTFEQSGRQSGKTFDSESRPRWIVTTTILGESTIEQSVLDVVLKTTTTHIADTKEAQLRQALIKLGWTPPEGK